MHGNAFAPALDLLARRTRTARAPPGPPIAFEPGRVVPTSVAVDGSHAVLVDNGAVWVVAVRAAAVQWPGPLAGEAATQVVAVLADDAQDHVDERYAAAGLTAPHVRGADAFAEALRAVEEMEEARHACARLDGGALLLVDGALHGLPSHAASLMDPVIQAATLRGVRLVGVAKRSSIPWLRAAEAAHPGGPWRLGHDPLAGSWVARLHAGAGTCYRVDVAGGVGTAADDRHDHSGLEAVFADLAALSRDAVYCGYPYPLAVAHNHVAYTAGRVAALRGQLEARARAAGLLHVLDDPHAMLDRAVPS